MQADSTVRVAVDVGGTFTDLHLHNPATGRILTWKTPSTPSDPSIGLINGLCGIADHAGLAVSDIGLILHGSTIATNAVLQRKLPRGALITTQGFRDVLEIGRHIRRDVYTLRAETRSLLIPRQWRFGVRARITADGSVRHPLDEAAVHAIVEHLLADDIEAVAITFLHSYRNPVHELRAAEIISHHAPGLCVTTSCQTSPEIREFERTSTTVLNALLRPVISGYLERVTRRLRDEGIDAALYLVQSNGGLATPEDAAKLPARLLLSGPAGGAMAMASLARRHKIKDLVGFDMGGTSSDISVVRNGHIGETPESSIDGLPVRLPMVDIRTIGAGGGSIARVETSALRVGPDSAGAEPGPVCYQRGGTEPTVTDANAVLGRIDAAGFQTGGMSLDTDASRAAVAEKIAEPLAMSTDQAAAGLLDVATTNMAAAIRLSLFEKGADPADFSLAPFGGAAGLHACAVAEELGIHRIVFPAHASTLSALGILQADLRHDLSVSQLMPANEGSVAGLAQKISQLHQDATALLEKNGFTENQRRLEFSCDMRYRGQAFELVTPWPAMNDNPVVSSATVQSLIDNFHRLHAERFAHSSPTDAVEIVTIRVAGVGKLATVDISTAVESSAAAAGRASSCQRTLYLDGRQMDVTCIHRESLSAAMPPVDGPIVIEENYTVLLIHQGWTIQSLGNGDLLCARPSGAAT